MSPNGLPTPVICLCADDYGIAPGVGIAIRRLIRAGRLSAVSCMTATAHWSAEAVRLRPLGSSVQVGLHLSLTCGRPAGPMAALAPAGRLPSLARLVRKALAGAIDRAEIEAEIDRQLDRFEDALGRPPDFLDGHQHVHQLPGIRDAVFAVHERRLKARGAWLRYPAMPATDLLAHRVAKARTLAINLLGRGFRTEGRSRGIPGNARFRGVRDFVGEPPYGELFARFIRGLGAGDLVMCHPGLVDDELRAVDPLTDPRQEEFRFLLSPQCGDVLSQAGLSLGPLNAKD
jgi:hypothetical protein